MFDFLSKIFRGNSDHNAGAAMSDQELAENVRDRLALFGGLEQPAGRIIRSIPGATVKFIEMAGMVVAAIFTDDERFIGSVLPDGRIVYSQQRS